MGLTEEEIEKRLRELRHEREVIDRQITDLVLYLELGRRLNGAGQLPTVDTAASDRQARIEVARQEGEKRDGLPPNRNEAGSKQPLASIPRVDDEGSASNFRKRRSTVSMVVAVRPGALRSATTMMGTSEAEARIPPAIAFAEDPTAARRYGRALIEAACVAIAEAGRSLHASEILERLVARGFTVPGRDPVAALNTRLWKRATPDGPLKRLGDASYALARNADAVDNSGNVEV